MASVSIARASVLLLVSLSMTWSSVNAAAAYHVDNRVPVPVSFGGEPVVAENRKGYPQPSYESYDSYYHEPVKADGGKFLAYVLPALAITGLSLLFPNVITVNTGGRRRRDAGSETPIDELSEHMMNIYYAAMESDECIQRIVCELGATARSFKSDNLTSMISLLSGTVPTKFNKLFEKFKSGMNLEKCEKLGCSILDK